MLEVKNLVKIYKPKKGVPVCALAGVSLRFPEKGMVFLLGKSGSGKSTLLNVLGGLDRYNTGEILIKGRSSETFKQRDFDSYRNTYLGFIFQEYNILDEFSVGANIALALQLQGKKPTTEEINRILEQVDLVGYGNRKPNELSGGQKQRVAIARALVKNPEIIMADEPTGALDSATGQQVLTTLKKLSADKLVIVVSHDREFADKYADRIIELADGKVIRDVERQHGESNEELTKPVFEGDTLHVPLDYEFTQEDSLAITRYIQQMLSQGRQMKVRPSDINDLDFVPTNEDRIAPLNEGYHLIRSRLPMKYAFKLGASGLKHKKFRLFMTIFLCVIAFTLFGMSDTVAGFDYVQTSVSSLMHPDSQVPYASFELQKEIKSDYDDDISWFSNVKFPEAEWENLVEKSGLKTYPVYTFGSRSGRFSGVGSRVYTEDYTTSYEESQKAKRELCLNSFAGFVVSDEELLSDMGAELVAGKLPAKGTNEVAVSTYVYKSFEQFGYVSSQGEYTETESGEVFFAEPKSETVSTYKDLIGKEIVLDSGIPLIISGIVDTGIDYERYKVLEEDLDYDSTMTDQIVRIVLQSEWNYATTYSLTGLAIVDESVLAELANAGCVCMLSGELEIWDDSACSPLSADDIKNIKWLDGKKRTELAEDELIISRTLINRYDLGPGYSEDMEPSPIYDEEGNIVDYEMPEPDESELFGKLAQLYTSIDAFYDFNSEGSLAEVKLVGILEDEKSDNKSGIILSDGLMRKLGYVFPGDDTEIPVTQTLAKMPADREQVRLLAELSDEPYEGADGNTYRYNLQNPVSFELRGLKEIFAVLKDVFFWIGLVMLAFASLLFANFIGTSVAYKKRQIGILRAIGSRSTDVFRIFFSESFIIAMINFVISFGLTFVLSQAVNNSFRNEAGLLVTVLNVGIRQVIILFVTCVAAAFVASFLPVWKIASKRPVDAINDR